MASIRITAGEGASEHPIRMGDRPFVIGRAQACDLQIKDNLSSRKHCRLVPDGSGGWSAEDLGSRNGTQLNSEPLTDLRPLTDGDVIRIGEVEITFSPTAPRAPALPDDGSAPSTIKAIRPGAQEDDAAFGAPGTVYELQFTGRGGTFDRVLDSPITTVGRGDDADIVIHEPLSSRIHCQFEVAATGIKVVDLESRNGTQVNGDTINQKFLDKHDRIQVGETLILVTCRPPTTTSELAGPVLKGGRGNGAVDTATLTPEIPATPARNARMDARLVWTEKGQQRSQAVNRDMLVVGRSEHAEVTIDEPLASREHFVLRRLSAGGFELEDLESRNGTRLNGREVRGRIQVVHGDVIQVGDVSLRVDVAGGPAPGAGMLTTPIPGQAAVPGPGGKRNKRRRRRRMAARDGGTAAAIGIAVGVIAAVAIVAAIVHFGGTPDDRRTNGNGPRVTNSGTNPIGNRTANLPDMTNDLPSNNTIDRTNQPGANTPPANEDEAFVNAPGISDLERRARRAWVTCRTAVAASVDAERYGEAWVALGAFVGEWQFQPRSDLVVQLAEEMQEQVESAAMTRWREEFVPGIEATDPAERESTWRERVERAFGGIGKIEWEAQDLFGR